MDARRVTLPACALTLAAAIASAQELPEGAGKDVTARLCGECHEAQKATSVRLTRDGWEATILDMVSRGMKATDEELQIALEYLAKHFPGEASRPLNINTATNVELESVLGLLRKEAAALITHRQKHGKFKSLDELRKVAGVDFKKIASNKDSIVF